MSTIFPLASSPHCKPITQVPGIAANQNAEWNAGRKLRPNATIVAMKRAARNRQCSRLAPRDAFPLADREDYFFRNLIIGYPDRTASRTPPADQKSPAAAPLSAQSARVPAPASQRRAWR